MTVDVEICLRLFTGAVAAIDPYYLDLVQHPSPDTTPIFDEPEFQRSSPFEQLLLLEAAIFRRGARESLDTLGYCELPNFVPGVFRLKLSAVRSAKPGKASSIPALKDSVDTAQVLLFDASLLISVLRIFEWKRAYRNTGAVNRKREKAWALEIGGTDGAFVQIQSPGLGRGVDFIGDGEYFVSALAFQRAEGA